MMNVKGAPHIEPLLAAGRPNRHLRVQDVLAVDFRRSKRGYRRGCNDGLTTFCGVKAAVVAYSRKER